MERRIFCAGYGGLLLAVAVRPGRAEAADAQVTIDDFAFVPAVLTVPVGTVVTWTNRDDIPHSVADAEHPKEAKSPPLDTGDTYRRMFTTAGTYRYFCSLHPHMQGTVIVE